MRITLEPTAQFFRTAEGIPVRLWTGSSDQGTPLVAFIAAVAAPEGCDQSQLEAELKQIPGPNVDCVVIN